LPHHEEAIAVDGNIGVDAGGSHVALRKVGRLGTDLDTRALLDGIASSGRTDRKTGFAGLCNRRC
jgi:hypothetical protein